MEETGYLIELSGKLGVYQRPKFQDEQHVYAGNITGGQAIENGMETAGLKWFSPERLPLLMVPNRKMQIRDFLNGAAGIRITVKDNSFLAALDLFRRKYSKR